MVTASGEQASARIRVPETIQIVNWPLRDEGLRIWLVGLVMIGIGMLAAEISNSAAMGTFCGAALLLSTWRFWLPVTFELGTKGLVQSTLIFRWRIPWRCFARFETRPQGVWLMRDAEPTPWSSMRGIHVQCRDQQEQVLDSLRFFLAARRQRAANTTRTFTSE